MTLKNTFYSSLSILFAGMVVIAGMVAWYYIGRTVWDFISMAFG